MARTEAGRLLTENHRRRQLAVRARSLQEFLVLTRLWDVSRPESFNRLVEAAIPFVQARNGTSAAEAARYFEAFRTAEGVTGQAAATVGSSLPRDKIAGSLYSTGQSQALRALQSGLGVESVRQTTVATMSGAVTRLVLDGGRDTVLESSLQDRQIISWMRVTSGDPCPFCAMLASRGPAYTSRDSAIAVTGRGGRPRGNRQIGESYHDNCVCSIEPYYEGSTMPPSSQRWRDLWNESQLDAEAEGELDRGTKNDALNAFRRALSRELTTDA
jgi:hypothetical protein